VAGTAALQGVAGDVPKITFLVAAGTSFWKTGRSNSISTFAAFPISHVALRANISNELAVSCKPA